MNEHNGPGAAGSLDEDWERQRVIDFRLAYPLDGYRRLTFMMLDEDGGGLDAPSTTETVCCRRPGPHLDRWNVEARCEEGRTGFGSRSSSDRTNTEHTTISCVLESWQTGDVVYYLCSFLDECESKAQVVHWEIRESMTEADVECILERAKELYPDARPRIISDNGPQYIAKDFKTFIRISGMTHVRTAPYYPQSNGKIERWHKTIKSDALRPANPSSLEEARRLMERFVEYYNGVRLHSAIGYIAPLDFMAGKAPEIWSERDRKLEQAREARRERRSNKVPA